MQTVALYMRLSLEDEEDGESGSIKNQRTMLTEFAKKEFSSANILQFCDDGYSGTNFDRPAVKEMLAMARAGVIQCIVVKDFSRFGRNFVEVGDYIEQIFPFLGVRFIAVANDFDSKDNAGASCSLDIAFKNLLNDYYSKDISIKVKSAAHTRMQKGDYISAYAPFGYKKSTKDNCKLVIDYEAAQIVRLIFELGAANFSTTETAKRLNNQNTPTPLIYKAQAGITRKWNTTARNSVWTRAAVLKILRDERYTGKIICGKRETIKAGSGKSEKIEQSQWTVVPNMHEAIVDEELFLQVQQKTCKNNKSENCLKHSHALKGKVFCATCSHLLRRKNCAAPYYYCDTPKVSSSCSLHSKLLQSDLEAIVLMALNSQIRAVCNFDDYDKIIIKKLAEETAQAQAEVLSLDTRLLQKEAQKIKLYEEYALGKVTKEYYVAKKRATTEDIAKSKLKLQNAKLAVDACKEKYSSNLFVTDFISFGTIRELTPELVAEFIERILVHSEGEIEIVFKFADIFVLS